LPYASRSTSSRDRPPVRPAVLKPWSGWSHGSLPRPTVPLMPILPAVPVALTGESAAAS